MANDQSQEGNQGYFDLTSPTLSTSGDESPVKAPPPVAEDDIAIDVRDVSKLYRLYPGQRARIVEWLTLGRRKYHYPFWALKDVSLQLPRGKALGLIGPNGSGKSTLLKLIAGTSTPTEGEIIVNGSVAALLELGAGFHAEFTGRQNIRMNAQIFGLSDEKIDELMPEIIDFAELDRYIDMPVRTYSSGMYARLGFAVASHVDPDILIIDEALAVGDLYFQRKSLDRIIYFREMGKTILFVSHVMPVIQRFCDEVIWLDEGKIRSRGHANKVTKEYDMWSLSRHEKSLGSKISGRPASRSDQRKAEFKILGESWGSGEVRIVKVEMLGADGKPRWHFNMNERDVKIRIHYYAFERIENPIIGINFHRIDGIYIFGTGNVWVEDHPLQPMEGLGYVDYKIDRLYMHKGTFFLTVAIFPEPDIPYWKNPCDFHNQMYEFTVVSESEAHGIVSFDGSWNQQTKIEDASISGVPPLLEFRDKMTPHYLHKGWYDIEHTKDFSFAWTLDSAGFVITQPGYVSDLAVELNSNKPDISDSPITIELWEEDKRLDSVQIDDNAWQVIKFDIGQNKTAAVRHLNFVVKPTWSPKNYGNPDDDRDLGIGVRRIWCSKDL